MDLTDEQIRKDIRHHRNRIVHVLAWGFTQDELAQVMQDFQRDVWCVRWRHE
jgi:hypothetical protein